MNMSKNIKKPPAREPKNPSERPCVRGFQEGDGQEPLKLSPAMQKALKAVRNMGKKSVH